MTKKNSKNKDEIKIITALIRLYFDLLKEKEKSTTLDILNHLKDVTKHLPKVELKKINLALKSMNLDLL